MTCYVGLDVSMKETAICFFDEAGERVWAGTSRTDPEVITAVLKRRALGALKVGIETGPLTVWLWHALNERGLPIVCLHARHAVAALKLQMVSSVTPPLRSWRRTVVAPRISKVRKVGLPILEIRSRRSLPPLE